MITKVRFAPSPTGYLHLGGARTALFNYIYAKKTKGQFILRIEDTDKKRSKVEFVNDILESLRWLNINWDEGPIFQSERISLYQKIIDQLLKEGKAYYCFCSKEELEQKKIFQISQGLTPRYDRTCLKLSKEEINKKISQNIPYVIRLRVPDQVLIFKDFLRGEIKFDLSLIGDFVIAKSLTEPLFHLSTPIDDYYQGITHIIRGAEHISNTPKQIMIYKQMNWKLPIYVHIPLLLNEGGGKLSKRKGAKSILEYKKEGHLPEAIINFLILLGWHPEGEQEIISLEEIIQQFELEKLEVRPCALNLKKLSWLNRIYLRKKLSQEILKIINSDEYFSDIKEIIKNTNYNDEQINKIIELGKERANTIKEIFSSVNFFFKEFDFDVSLLKWKDYSLDEIKVSLETTLKNLSLLEDEKFKAGYLKNILDNLHNDKGYIYWPLRVALTGLQYSPPPIEIMEILGKEKTLKLIEKAINKLS
ncbi:MAG: glutamate--tRNA ligase [Candidatus Parcubacteria bacterium]|nr:MAG: glutamate--tRNA ligase [Candidatus Parcubacteria bacterium]